jgi:hypothetical protein
VIKDQKELGALLKLCRKQGVTEITLEGISIKFGDMPPRKAEDSADAEEQDGSALIDGLTPDQMAFYNANMPGEQ